VKILGPNVIPVVKSNGQPAITDFYVTHLWQYHSDMHKAVA